jgi:hypothetical protein
VGDDELAAFVRLMTTYTYDYIHLLEYTLWRMAAASEVPLACILTPALAGPQRPCTPEEQHVVTLSMGIKTLANNEQLSRTGCAHMVRDWFPALKTHPLAPGEWMNRALLMDYYRYMDMDDLATL